MSLPPLVFRSVKGSPLTDSEGDGNITNLDSRITGIETAPSSAISIAYIAQSDDFTKIVFHMTDHSLQGPFTLPIGKFTPRGAWAASTQYNELDIVSNAGTTYLVNFAHISGATFDAFATDGDGHDLYYELVHSEVGPIGERGRKGFPGNDGDDGLDGFPGSRGARGGKGLKGDTGDKGDTGSAGTPGGPPGPTGRTGLGLQGDVGFPGQDGMPGRRGKKGAAGSAGAKGDTGDAGADGAKGDTGLVGVEVAIQSITASGTLVIDRSAGEWVKVNLTGDISSFSVSNPAGAGNLTKLVLKITNAATHTFDLSLLSGSIAPGGVFPVIASGSGKITTVIILSDDVGSTWLVNLGNLDYHS